MKSEIAPHCPRRVVYGEHGWGRGSGGPEGNKDAGVERCVAGAYQRRRGTCQRCILIHSAMSMRRTTLMVQRLPRRLLDLKAWLMYDIR